MGALLIARREKDEKHQKALRNFRWTVGTGLGGVICLLGFKWGTAYIDRIQAAAEARDAAFVTAMAELTEKMGTMSDRTGELATRIMEMRALAIGAKRLPDCPQAPPCICKPPPVSCPPGAPVIVTFPPPDKTEPAVRSKAPPGSTRKSDRER